MDNARVQVTTIPPPLVSTSLFTLTSREVVGLSLSDVAEAEEVRPDLLVGHHEVEWGLCPPARRMQGTRALRLTLPHPLPHEVGHGQYACLPYGHLSGRFGTVQGFALER